MKNIIQQSVQPVSGEHIVAERNTSQVLSGNSSEMDEDVAALGITKNEPWFAFIGDAMVRDQLCTFRPQELRRAKQHIEFVL